MVDDVELLDQALQGWDGTSASIGGPYADLEAVALDVGRALHAWRLAPDARARVLRRAQAMASPRLLGARWIRERAATLDRRGYAVLGGAMAITAAAAAAGWRARGRRVSGHPVHAV